MSHRVLYKRKFATEGHLKWLLGISDIILEEDHQSPFQFLVSNMKIFKWILPIGSYVKLGSTAVAILVGQWACWKHYCTTSCIQHERKLYFSFLFLSVCSSNTDSINIFSLHCFLTNIDLNYDHGLSCNCKASVTWQKHSEISEYWTILNSLGHILVRYFRQTTLNILNVGLQVLNSFSKMQNQSRCSTHWTKPLIAHLHYSCHK